MSNKSIDALPAEWPVCDQDRELWCLRHLTDELVEDEAVVSLQVEVPIQDVVTLYSPRPVEHLVSVSVLRQAGLVILFDDGNKVVYC